MPEVVHPPRITLKILLAPGVTAARQYWKPFALLQGAAFLLVLGYYTTDHLRLICEQLSRFKQQGGLIFTAITAAFAGGLMPEFAKAIVLGERTITRQRIRNVCFALVIFGVSGIIVDFQYRGLAWLFGSDARLLTIARKTLFDQFVTTPIYGAPYWVLFYLLRANRYNVVATAAQISPHWYVTRVMPLLLPTWCFWIPMVTLIYALPTPLQFFLFCFASAAWSLVMVFVATLEAEEDSVQNDRIPSSQIPMKSQ